MDLRHQKNQLRQPRFEDEGHGKGGSFFRQSSSRWTPTSEQVRILKDLYYNNGVRSPTADRIQKISATLSRYGKVEGKNVFYWFQNQKARERQKKRFTATSASEMPPQRRSFDNGNGGSPFSKASSSSPPANDRSPATNKVSFEDEDAEIDQTLPLFPIHGDRNSDMMKLQPEHSDNHFTRSWPYWAEETGGRTLLELSLNSYGGGGCQEQGYYDV